MAKTLLISGQNAEIIVEKNNSVVYINFQSPLIKQTFRLKENSRLTLWNIYFETDSKTQAIEVYFDEKNAVCVNRTVFLGKKNCHLNLFVSHIHNAPLGTSQIISRGILADSARAYCKDVIKILNTAAQTDASLEEKTLLLSENSEIETIPELQIETNDVKASHSASVAKIDEEQLFYAASRGIPEKQAKALIMEGFLKNSLKTLPSESLKETFQKYLWQ